ISSTARKYSWSSSTYSWTSSTYSWTSASSTIAIVDELQAHEGEHGVDPADELGAGGDEVGLAAGRDDRLDVRHLGEQPLQDAVHQADVPVVDARLHGARRVLADQLGRLAHVDPVEARGTGEQGLGRDHDARRDDTARVLPGGVDQIERGGRAEIHHDHR